MTESSVSWLQVIIDVAPEAAEPSAAFWSAALGWSVGEPWPTHGEFRSFVPPEATPYVHQQTGDHGPRIHFDAEVPDLSAATERISGLGATAGLLTPDWQVMTSPGGLPFCLLHPQRSVRPGPRTWPDGHRTRPVQVCIDIPAQFCEREIEFWQQMTGWRWERGDSPEFAGKLYPEPSSPVQVLLQRLDSPEEATRAHLDLGTDDLEGEVRRLVDLGATRGETGRGWVVMTDPTGLVFCVTGNSPD